MSTKIYKKECLDCGYTHTSPNPYCISCGSCRSRLIVTDVIDDDDEQTVIYDDVVVTTGGS